MQQFLYKIWTVWCVLIYAFWLIFFFPIMLVAFNIPSKAVKRWAHNIPNYISWCSIRCFGIRVKYFNAQYVDLNKQYIFISNHRSFLDILTSMGTIPNYKKYLGKAEVGNWPIMGYIIKNLYVMVDRSSPESRTKSMEAMKDAIDEGASIFIYPEGRRAKSHERPLMPFYLGAFKLAIETNTPIAMLTNLNADELLPQEKLFVKPGVFKTVWSPVIETKDLTLDDAEWLRDKCHAEMLQILESAESQKNPISLA